MYIWDTNNIQSPLKQEQIDTASGMLMPVYDQDSSVLFLAGKGDGNIRYYEWVDDQQGLHFLSEYKSSDPQRGIGILPKRAVNTADVEITRLFKVHVSLVEPIAFKVPRKVDCTLSFKCRLMASKPIFILIAPLMSLHCLLSSTFLGKQLAQS